jgi:hypothetical protein
MFGDNTDTERISKRVFKLLREFVWKGLQIKLNI